MGTKRGADRGTEACVEEALTRVHNPTAGTTVVEAGLVEDISLSGTTARIGLDMETAADRGWHHGLAEAVREAVTGVEGVTAVEIDGDDGTDDAGTAPATGFDAVETVIAVASTKGGVGKSTVATRLACALAADAKVGLFDADVYGPNVPALLDASGPVESDERGNPEPVTVDGLGVMSVDFMHDDGPLAWRGSVAHDALTDLFAETAWTDRDTVVVDLPPGTGDVVLTVLQEAPVDGVVLVTTPFETSVEDTARGAEVFAEQGVPVLGTVLNMAEHTCPDCGDTHALFGDRPTDLGIDAPLLATLPFDEAYQSRPRPGRADEPFRSLATSVREQLASRGHMAVPDDAVDIRGLSPEARYDAVAAAFDPLDAGDDFYLRSDRDPTPVREYLAELAGVADPESAFDPFTVERHGPEEWVLHTVRP